MELEVKYQGRTATVQEVNYINEFIDSHPEHSRRRISQELCKQWNWLYSNGSLKDQGNRSQVFFSVQKYKN